MSKGHKRPPPPPLAPTAQDTAHLNWIQRNSADLVRSALTLYRKRGRGAFLIREGEAKPSGTSAHYLAVTSIRTGGIVWPDYKTAERVRSYDPAQQFVIVFQYRSGATSSYTMQFIQVDGTFTVEAT